MAIAIRKLAAGRSLSAFWSRLPFVARLALSAGVALMVAAITMLAMSIQRDAAWHRENLARLAEAESLSLMRAVAGPVVIGDYSTLEQTLAAHASRIDVAGARFVDSTGHIVRSDSEEPLLTAPHRFARWIGLPWEEHSRSVDVGGRHYGTLTVSVSSTPAVNRIWAGFLDHLHILLLAVGLDFLGIVLILKTGLRPLAALEQGAARIAGGEFETRIPEKGSPEIRSLTAAFNGMAENVQALIEGIHDEKELAEVTLRSIGDAVITVSNEEAVTFLNPVAEQLTGWSNAEAQGRHLSEVFAIINELTRAPAENPVEKVLREGRIVGLANHTVLVSRSGEEYVIEDSAAPIRSRDGNILGVVLVFHDTTGKRMMEREMTWQATHDALTGLANRREFELRLEELMRRARSEDSRHALLYLDLDQFKVVNDTCGHLAGDELLSQITRLFREKVRESDTLARLGGDEFGVLLENCPSGQAEHIANTLLDTVRNFRFVWDGRSFSVGVSIGIAIIDAAAESSQDILMAADTACYAAKDAGRNRVHLHNAEDQETRQRRGEMNWVARISQALDEDRFVLYQQPIRPVGVPDGNFHFEILLRMVDEEGNVVAPAAFVPAAERYHLMSMLDRWVVRHALNWLAAHTRETGCCAINLSGQSIGDEKFLVFLMDQIEGTGVDPKKICFEITETAAIANLARATFFISALRAMGCRFSLDDFGSGLSSFGYLKNLPVDFLKIDGNIVRNIAQSHVDYTMVQAIHDIGRVMNIQTIAEFVENAEILDKLRSIGVGYAQGYGISQPMPIEGFAAA